MSIGAIVFLLPIIFVVVVLFAAYTNIVESIVALEPPRNECGFDVESVNATENWTLITLVNAGPCRVHADDLRLMDVFDPVTREYLAWELVAKDEYINPLTGTGGYWDPLETITVRVSGNRSAVMVAMPTGNVIYAKSN